MNVGEKIKKLRELKNYTQQHMAEKLDLSLSGYGKIERNDTDISVSKLEKIAEVLGVELSTILNFDEKFIFYVADNKQANVSLKDQYIKQMELFDKMSQQYKDEIQYLRTLVSELTEKLKG